MRADEAAYLMRAIGCHDIRIGARFVNASCPFARWKHRGRDKTPSFGIQIDPDGESRFRCMGCGAGGGLIELLWMIESRFKTRLPELHAFVRSRNVDSLASLKLKLDRAASGSPWQRGPEAAPGSVSTGQGAYAAGGRPPPLPEESLFYFDFLPRAAMEWQVFKKRCIRYDTLRRWGLLWHPKAQRIGLPVRDREGHLVGITGRLAADDRCLRCNAAWKIVTEERAVRQPGWSGTEFVDRKVCSKCGRPPSPKYLHSTGFRKDFYLFGEHLVPDTRPHGCLVEGHFDAIGVTQAGHPTVAGMGSFLGFEQAASIARLFSAVTIIPDGDPAGKTIAWNYWRALAPRLPVFIAETPEGKDPDELGDDAVREVFAAAKPGGLVGPTLAPEGESRGLFG